MILFLVRLASTSGQRRAGGRLVCLLAVSFLALDSVAETLLFVDMEVTINVGHLDAGKKGVFAHRRGVGAVNG